MVEKRALNDEDITTTWMRAGGGSGLQADPDSTDPDSTDADGTDGDTSDSDTQDS
ncbi:MAG TPA: hypothetical protein VM784_10945 [Actinomycetota bacterium]|nr:hypothetical protein [Actinomycetota bacterium]